MRTFTLEDLGIAVVITALITLVVNTILNIIWSDAGGFVKSRINFLEMHQQANTAIRNQIEQSLKEAAAELRGVQSDVKALKSWTHYRDETEDDE